MLLNAECLFIDVFDVLMYCYQRQSSCPLFIDCSQGACSNIRGVLSTVGPYVEPRLSLRDFHTGSGQTSGGGAQVAAQSQGSYII